jgi:hypothetical protein
MSITTGSCFCGAICYEIKGKLTDAKCCHCSRCRKAFSGSGSAMARVSPGAFHWLQGEDSLRTYINKQDIGLGFCGTCGTTLCGLHKGEVFGIALGTLDGNPDVRIAEHIFVGSKAGWDEIGGDAPQYAEASLNH